MGRQQSSPAHGTYCCLVSAWQQGGPRLVPPLLGNPRRRFWAILAAASGMALVFLLVLWPLNTADSTSLYQTHVVWIDLVAGLFAAASFAWLQECLRSSEETGISAPLLVALSWRPLVAVGAFSYSLYLVHAPVVAFFIQWLLPRLRAHGMILAGNNLVAFDFLVVAAALALAYGFHLAVERPFMSRPAPKTEQDAESVAVVSPAP